MDGSALKVNPRDWRCVKIRRQAGYDELVFSKLWDMLGGGVQYTVAMLAS
jgi:hypothetical protein